MILKGSQRGGGRDLAAHLMRADDNEHVQVHELRGFAGDDLRDAFKEAEAISRGTRCRQYLFSLSLSPPEEAHVSVADFEDAIERAESRLGLDGQPRAVVFHEKEGRRHAHAVWSRIDAETMTARPMSFFKTKLTGLSRDLYLDHGWEMPRGLAQSGMRDPANFSLAEWQQAKRQGYDPRWLKAALQDCWKASDNARAFGQALQERGFHLARGDKRGFVVLDHDGEVHSLPRALALKTKEVRDRLGDGLMLPSVSEAQGQLAARMTPAIRRHVTESRERFEKRSATLGRAKEEMTRMHRVLRDDLDRRQRDERDGQAKARAARLPRVSPPSGTGSTASTGKCAPRPKPRPPRREIGRRSSGRPSSTGNAPAAPACKPSSKTFGAHRRNSSSSCAARSDASSPSRRDVRGPRARRRRSERASPRPRGGSVSNGSTGKGGRRWLRTTAAATAASPSSC